MAGSKEFELLFKLKASLGGGFNNTFKGAIETQKALQDSIKQVNSLQSKTNAYSKTAEAISKNKTKLEELNIEHDKLQTELRETMQQKKNLQKAMSTAEASNNIEEYKKLEQELKATNKEYDRLKDKVSGNKNQIQQTTAKIQSQKEKLNDLGQELREAGANTENLAKYNAKLEKSYSKLKTSQDNLQRIHAQQQKVNDSISKTKSQLVGTIGVVTAIGAAIVAGPVKAAMSFESNMAEVAKVVSWLKDDTGKITKDYTDLKNQIIGLTTQIPMTAEEISQIMAAAGQSDVAFDNKGLVEFTEAAAKMGIAFDVSSSQAGEWMAKWRTSFKMSQSEVIELADKINYLGNTSAADAPAISAIVTKIGPLGEVAGFASGQIAALGATLVSTGVQEDVAATGIKNLMLAMVQGNSVTKRQAAVLDRLGINGKKLAQRMQTDATGAIMDFLEAIKKLPKAEQAAALKDYFGKESVNAIAPLLTNLGYLEEQFKKVGDASKYTGSMEGEYSSRADTTENKVQLAKNSLKALSIVIGDTFLPTVGKLADKLSAVIIKATEFAQANPKLTKTIIGVVGGLAALKIGGLAVKLAFLDVKKGINAVHFVMGLFKQKTAIAGVQALSTGGKLKTMGSGILGYFKNVKGAMGGVGNMFGGLLGKSTIFTKIGTMASGLGGKMVAGIMAPFSKLGLLMNGVFGKVTSMIITGPIGKIGSLFGSVFGKFGTFLAPIGNLLKTAFAPLVKLGTTILGPLGGIFGKIFPIIGVITIVITVIQLLKKHINEVRAFIEKTFGKNALAVFDKIIAVIGNIGEAIKGVFSDGNIGAGRNKMQELFGDKGIKAFDIFINGIKTVQKIISQFISFVNENIVPVAEQILNVIVTNVIPLLINAFKAAAPIVMKIISAIASFIGQAVVVIGRFIAALMPVISQIIGFIATYVIPIIQQVFQFITGTVLPMILSGIQTILPIIMNVLNTLLSFIQTAISTIWGIVQPILQAILALIQFIMPTIFSIVKNVISTIGGVIKGVVTIIQGVINFVTGVFTGNWKQAWQGVKQIFAGYFGGITAIAKGVINGVISILNTGIRALNKLKIPDWVPKLGGKGINIPEIPQFANGTPRTPRTFIAGEKGPELITNAPNMKVFTASETSNIMRSQKAATTAKETTRNFVPAVAAVQTQAPQVSKGAGRSTSYSVVVHNQPVIQIDGSKPNDLDEKLKKNNEDLLRQMDEKLGKKEDDERRSRYE